MMVTSSDHRQSLSIKAPFGKDLQPYRSIPRHRIQFQALLIPQAVACLLAACSSWAATTTTGTELVFLELNFVILRDRPSVKINVSFVARAVTFNGERPSLPNIHEIKIYHMA